MMLTRNVFKPLIFILVFILIPHFMLWGQDVPDIERADYNDVQSRQLAKTQSTFDRGVGFLDMGKLVVLAMENYGMQGHSDIRSIRHGWWGEIRWFMPVLAVPPQSWATNIQHEDGFVVDRSMNYNCIESICQRLFSGNLGVTYSDWEAKDRSRGQLMGDGDDTWSGIPLIATSTRPLSWPEGYFDDNGQFVETPDQRHWPGYWALDPDPDSPTFGQPVEGQFVSSKDVYYVFNDKYNGIRQGDEQNTGYPIGFEMEVSGYCYSARAYEDIVFFNYNLIYRDDFANDPTYQHHNGTIDDLYFGFIIDPDLPGADPNRNQTSPWAEDDYCYADTERDIFVMYDKDGYEVEQTSPYSEGPVSAYAVAFLKTPTDESGNEIGLTGFHFYDQDVDFANFNYSQETERNIYAMMSGQKELCTQDNQARYFHGTDPNFDDLTLLREFQEPGGVQSSVDVHFIMSSGPFSITPGDTLPLHFAIIAGWDEPGPLDADGFPTNPYEIRFADVIENYDKAMELYLNKFQGTGPPKSPVLSAVGTKTYDANGLPIIYTEHQKVTLYWNDIAEETRDILTKQKDFEGYKIYKSIYDPEESSTDWGVEIYTIDATGGRGDVIGYEPVFQCDLDNEWEGLDPNEPTFYLGNNSGVVHSWTDTDVESGIRYRYCITAYDRPYLDPYYFPSNETPRGTTSKDFQVVDVIPGKRPLGFVEASFDSTFERISGMGTGTLELEIVDSDAITGHSYKVMFDDTTSGALEYRIYNEDLGQIMDLMPPGQIYSTGNVVDLTSGDTPTAHPIVDGFALKVVNHDLVSLNDPVLRIYNKGWTAVSGTASTYDFEVTRYYKAALAADYEIRFLGPNADTTTIGTKTLPFQIWNVSQIPPVKVDMLLNPRTGDFKDKDLIILNETVDGKYTQTWAIIAYFIPPDDTTGMVPVAPAVGDVYSIQFKKPFTSDDSFRFKTTPFSVEAITEDDLDRIRVVPNPYVVTSPTELSTSDPDYYFREVRFINLPKECTINIYTLTGDHIRTIEHKSETYGEARWDLITKENLEIAYGIYLYVVKTPDGKTKIGKLAVVL